MSHKISPYKVKRHIINHYATDKPSAAGNQNIFHISVIAKKDTTHQSPGQHCWINSVNPSFIIVVKRFYPPPIKL